MIRYSLKSLLLMMLVFSWTALSAQESFTKQQVLDDLDYLKTFLEKSSYDLYAYTPKLEFEANYEQVKESLDKDSFTLLEATSIFQKVVSKANIGHTGIDFPGQAYLKYADGGGKIFPLELAFEDQKVFVRKNWSSSSSIRVGSEILSINGWPVEKVLEKIYPLISAENSYLKKAKIEVYSFPRYYWQVFGEQERFEVLTRSEGKIEGHSLNAILALEEYEMKREEIISWSREMKIKGASAYLKPGGFGGNETKYRQFIDSCFVAIKQAGSKNLIIDLRNNPGGENSFSDYLLAYIADQPFQWASLYQLKSSKLLKEYTLEKSDTTKAFFKEILSRENGEIYDYAFEAYPPQTPDKRFTGKVFVLINRQSHSQSAVAAAQVQDYAWGTIVGEKTGESPSLQASIFQFSLPNTGISVNVSKGYMVRVNGDRGTEGLSPDIFIRDHLLDEQDEILEGLWKQFRLE